MDPSQGTKLGWLPKNLEILENNFWKRVILQED